MMFLYNFRCSVHKVILSACSDIFAKNEDELTNIFSNYSNEVIDAILKYCYTGNISIRHSYKLSLENNFNIVLNMKFQS